MLVATSADSLSNTKVLSTMNALWKMKATFGVRLMLITIKNIMVTLDGAALHVQLLRKIMIRIPSVVISASFHSSTKVLSTMNAPWRMKVNFGAPLKLITIESI